MNLRSYFLWLQAQDPAFATTAINGLISGITDNVPSSINPAGLLTDSGKQLLDQVRNYEFLTALKAELGL